MLNGELDMHGSGTGRAAMNIKIPGLRCVLRHNNKYGSTSILHS
jgi:hypothetical protein